jgi:hypothetical protein
MTDSSTQAFDIHGIPLLVETELPEGSNWAGLYPK